MTKLKKQTQAVRPPDWMRYAEQIGQAMEPSQRAHQGADRFEKQKRASDKFRAHPNKLTEDA